MSDFALATWNVHGWVGRDDRRDPARSFEVISALDADVVALQEVEGDDWLAAAEQAGYRALLGSTREGTLAAADAAPAGGRGAFGNALLVRTPVLSLRRIDLSVAGRERRGALDATVQLATTTLRVVATHLGLSRVERRRQAAALAGHILEGDAGLDTVLLGDLNDWTRRARQLGPLERAVGPLSRVATFPSRRPILPLDRLALRAGGLALRVATAPSPAARMASDHLPLTGICRRLEAAPHSAP